MTSKELLQETLWRIAERQVSESIDLWPSLATQIKERRSFVNALRTRPLLAIAIVLLALLTLTTAAYAIGLLSGYIPGIGFVGEGAPLRVLTEPVSQTRKGITVTIEQVVVDSERSVIVYKTEGLTIAAANSNGEGGGPFGSPHLLRLPDGTELGETPFTGYGGTPEPLIASVQTEGGWPNYVYRLVYPPVAEQINELTLIIPVLQNMPEGAAPENWQITFQLEPAPADISFAPVIEFSPQPEPVTTSAPLVEETNVPTLSNTATLNGFTFKLDNVIEVEEGFIFTGNLTWNDSVFPTGTGMLAEAVIPTLTDAAGQKIPIEEVYVDAPYEEHKMPWSYRTNRKVFSGPLVFSIASIKTSMVAPDIDFAIDFGAGPQIGQLWEVNRDFVVEGHTIRLLSVGLVAVPDTCQGVGVNFNFSGDAPEIFANASDVIPPSPMTCSGGGGGGGGGGPVDPLVFSTGVTYGEIPSGLHHYSIGFSVPFVVNGPWRIAWDPPMTPGPTPTSEAEACLTFDKWMQLDGKNATLPSELGGHLLISKDAGGLQISNLDGSGRSDLASGGWVALSPDGTHLLYTNENGFNLLNLTTGGYVTLGIDGGAAVWSPDGSQILYTTFDGLYVSQADGSASRKIDTGAAQFIMPIGWLPDHQSIVYSVYGGEGFTFTTQNLQTGETRELFAVQNKAGFGAVSSNGEWIAFVDRVFGAQNWGVFVSRLDGSERKLVVSPEVSTAFYLAWSPSVNWLLVNTRDEEQGNLTPIYKPVLIEPATCQFIGLPPASGNVVGWFR